MIAMARQVTSFDAERLRPFVEPLARTWRHARDLWLAGARAALPASWLETAFGRKDSLLLLEREDDGVRGHLVAGDARGSVFIPDATRCLTALDDWLETLGRSRTQLRLGLVLDKAHYLGRTFVLPESAVASLPSVLEQEVLRRTPFELEEIWQAATLTRGTAATRTVHQWIIRRDRAQAAMAAFGLKEDDLDFLSVGAADAADAAIITLRGREHVRARPADRPLRFAAAMAASASVVALLAWSHHDNRMLETLAARMETARTASGEGSRDPGAVSTLLLRKANPGLVRIWAELSRIIPDDTYLKDIRLTDDSVTINGFSSNAVALVRIIDASPLFARATLVGTIEPNPAEGRDRFSLAFDLRTKRNRPQRTAAASIGAEQP